MIVNLTGLLQDGSPQNPSVITDAATTLDMILGETVQINLQVTTPGGVIVSLTDKTIVLTVKQNPQANVLFSKAPTVHIGRSAVFMILPSDTRRLLAGLYYFDVWMTDGAGARNPVVPISSLNLGATVTPVP